MPENLKRINVRHFADMMERLSDYLSGIDMATADVEEYKAEMEAEWAAEWHSEMAQYMDYGYEG